MATIYRISLKSQEQRGAGQPNIVELSFADDADALAFLGNLELVTSAIGTSADKLLSSDYSLPYPAGTDSLSRTALTDGLGGWDNLRIFDTPSAFAPVTRSLALIAAGYLLPVSGNPAPVSVNVQVFTPGPSV